MSRKMINAADWLAALAESGFRVTAVQETLIDIFAHSEYPLSAEQAWDAARQSRPQTGRATVYRMVEKLENLGLVRRVHGYQGCSGCGLMARPITARRRRISPAGYTSRRDRITPLRRSSTARWASSKRPNISACAGAGAYLASRAPGRRLYKAGLRI